MKTVREVLLQWLLEKHENKPEIAKLRFDEIIDRWPLEVIRRALKNSTCTSYPQFVKICKMYTEKKGLSPIWQEPQ